MNLLADALAWLTDPAHWSGAGGLSARTVEHLGITALVVLLAALVAVPVGIVVVHTGRGAGLVGAVANGARAVPTLGLLTLVGLWIGIGLTAPVIALVVLAVPSLLAGTYAGIAAVDPRTRDAAAAQGMTTGQVIRGVELPLAAPVVVGAFRVATLQVVSTATLAAYVADVGLGRLLFAGLKTGDYAMMLATAIVVIALALVLELLWAAAQRLATTRLADPARRASRPGRQHTP